MRMAQPPLQSTDLSKKEPTKKENDQNKQEIIALNTVCNQLLRISNIPEGEEIVRTVISLEVVSFGIPTRENREHEIFGLGVRTQQHTLQNIRDLYVIVRLVNSFSEKSHILFIALWRNRKDTFYIVKFVLHGQPKYLSYSSIR